MKNVIKVGVLFGLAAGVSVGAFSAGDSTEVVEHMTGQVNAWKVFFMSAFYLIGLVSVGVGLFGIKKEISQPGQEHGKKAAVSILIGLILLMLGWFIDMSQKSINKDADGGVVNNDFGNMTGY